VESNVLSPGQRREFISRASILILAGFLIGFSISGRIDDSVVRQQILHCGVVGLIAFVALHFVARCRQHVIAERTLRQETERVLEAARCLTNMRQSLHEKVRSLESRSLGNMFMEDEPVAAASIQTSGCRLPGIEDFPARAR
jgi:hypothetical protein